MQQTLDKVCLNIDLIALINATT